MAIHCDFRKKGFKNRTYVHGLVRPNLESIERTRLDVFPSKREAVQEKQPGDYIVKLRKDTVQKLKRAHPFKAGWYLRYWLQFRPTVARQS